jgi:D-3-phosphoglycerate dehydrogenase
MIALCRKLVQADRSMREGRWAKSELVGEEITGKNVAIIGFGHIGRRTAQVLKLGFAMQVTIYDPTLKPEERDFCKLSGYIVAPSLHEAVRQAQFVILHPSISPTSSLMINNEIIAQMPRSVRILNMARAEICDQQALLMHIRSGHIGGLAIDPWWDEPATQENNPFINMENVIMTPHIGGNTKESMERVTKEGIQTVTQFLSTISAHDHSL